VRRELGIEEESVISGPAARRVVRQQGRATTRTPVPPSGTRPVGTREIHR
jgi:hypothetical protein